MLAAEVEGEAEIAVQERYLAKLIGAVRGDSVRLSTNGSDGVVLVNDPDDPSFSVLQMTMRLPSASVPAAEAVEAAE